MRRLALLSLVLVVVTLAAYWPVRQAEFTNFDDDLYVTDNPQVLHGLTSEGVKWAFASFHASNWHPVTWVSHMADVSLFGQSAAGSHLVNVGLHLANTLLLLLLLWRMTGSVWRSGFVAALFALHPLHVESVAWIAERKDVLSTFFGLLTLLAYARYVTGEGWRVTSGDGGERRRATSWPKQTSAVSQPLTLNPQPSTSLTRWYCMALLLFAAGLMSKPMLVTLPFVLLLLDYWPLGRFRLSTPNSLPRRSPTQGDQPSSIGLVLEKLPFFALSATSCVVTFCAQKSGGSVLTLKNIPFANRLANVAVAYASYLLKAVWPTKLAVPYPFILELPASQVALAVMGLLGMTVLCWVAARRAPYALVGWLWFLGTLVPVVGLVQVGTQAMADRYTYLPLIGVFVMVAWGAVELTKRWRWQRLGLPCLALGILAGCFLATRTQQSYWRSSLALFSHTLEVTANNPVAEQNLGYALALSGNQREAVRHFDAALRLWPDFPPALLNRGIARMLAGRVQDAIADYREVIRLQPDSENAYYQLADALAQQKKLAEARTSYLLALRYRPDFAEAHTKLGKLLLLQGDKSLAMSHLYEAVKIRPDYAEGQYALGNELAQQQKFAQAVLHLRAAVQSQPHYAPALNDLAWLLATQEDPAIRNVPEAIRLAQRACEVTRDKNAWLLATLGVAQSEAGAFPEAIRATEQALALAGAVDDQPTVARLRQRLESYRKNQPYHSVPR